MTDPLVELIERIQRSVGGGPPPTRAHGPCAGQFALRRAVVDLADAVRHVWAHHGAAIEQLDRRAGEVGR